MDKDNIIQLTNKLYRLSLLFPKKEPLRYKIREAGIDVLTAFLSFEKEENKKEEIFNYLEVLNTYFQITKWQNWVSFFDILEIEEKYDKIRKEIEEELKKEEKGLCFDFPVHNALHSVAGGPEENIETNKEEQKSASILLEGEEEKTEIGQDNNKVIELDARKKKILEILKEKNKVQVGQISKIMPEVSKRTIRRDFVHLLKEGIIERVGEKNDTFYQLK